LTLVYEPLSLVGERGFNLTYIFIFFFCEAILRNDLRDLLAARIEDELAPQSPLKFLKKTPVEDYLDTAIGILYLYTRPKKGIQKTSIYMVEIISAIGHAVRNRLKQKRDSSVAAKLGAFILYSFEQLGLIQVILGQGSKGHAAYIIQVLDDEAICALWENIDPSKIDKLPSETPFEPWTSSKHATGAYLVKTGNKEVLDKLRPETHPIIFDCINRAQAQGWNINNDIYQIHLWALRNRTEAFSDIWEQQNVEARATKLREAKAIGDIAKRFLNSTFYHLYYYDFRGRKYPSSAYLHEQGPDLARGLLLRADSKEIGEAGFRWLLISIASNWAGDSGREDGAKTDKIPLVDRVAWTLDNEEIILAYAADPKVHQGWMKADKPWQFLAACNELLRLRVWQHEEGRSFDDYSFKSHLEVYIDGSNNGSQHLSALTRDEVTAPHVNLVPQKMPGDLYKYVADHVWARLREKMEELDEDVIEDANRVIDTLIDLKRQITDSQPKSELRSALVKQIQEFKDENQLINQLAAPVYWMRVTDVKHRRKIVKRNVMTLPYGGTAYGLGQQQIDDAKKHGIDILLYLEHKWGAFLGREIFEDCKASLARPMQLLTVFEAAGRKAEAAGKFLSWTVPVTHFPVVQNYTEGVVRKLYVQYGPPSGARLSTGYYENTLQLAVCFIEDVVPSRGKQATGASPNAIHSLDAAHLAMTVSACPFSVTTIHDSFGCLLADMPELFKTVRRTFVELYKTDPLSALMRDIDGDTSNVELGTLSINLVLESEYCFV
jgi:DNA-directed RNA polymerase